MTFDYELTRAIGIAMKKLMDEYNNVKHRKYLEAWIVLQDIHDKLLFGDVHPTIAKAIEPFTPHTPTEQEKADIFRGDDNGLG